MTLPPREKFSLLGSLSDGSNTPHLGYVIGLGLEPDLRSEPCRRGGVVELGAGRVIGQDRDPGFIAQLFEAHGFGSRMSADESVVVWENDDKWVPEQWMHGDMGWCCHRYRPGRDDGNEEPTGRDFVPTSIRSRVDDGELSVWVPVAQGGQTVSYTHLR